MEALRIVFKNLEALRLALELAHKVVKDVIGRSVAY
jgi:hypothetical protein